MASTAAMRLRAVPLALRELWRTLGAVARREPNRLDAALAFARLHAQPGNADSVLAALDRFARERRMLINVGDEKGLVLDAELERLGPSTRVLELGCFAGYSAIRMARHLRPPEALAGDSVFDYSGQMTSHVGMTILVIGLL